jgi:hypothetical protein
MPAACCDVRAGREAVTAEAGSGCFAAAIRCVAIALSFSAAAARACECVARAAAAALGPSACDR